MKADSLAAGPVTSGRWKNWLSAGPGTGILPVWECDARRANVPFSFSFSVT